MGYYNAFDETGRRDVSGLDFTDPDLEYMSTVPRDSETHGGDDVGVYASGPWSHLFVGNYEQNNIPIAMAFASKLGPYSETQPGELKCSGASVIQSSFALVAIIAAMLFASY